MGSNPISSTKSQKMLEASSSTVNYSTRAGWRCSPITRAPTSAVSSPLKTRLFTASSAFSGKSGRSCENRLIVRRKAVQTFLRAYTAKYGHDGGGDHAVEDRRRSSYNLRRRSNCGAIVNGMIKCTTHEATYFTVWSIRRSLSPVILRILLSR